MGAHEHAPLSFLSMSGSILNREEIAALIAGTNPLVEQYIDLEEQLQPNGFDLTVREVASFVSKGQLGAEDTDRVLSSTEELPFDTSGWLELSADPYLLTFNEVVNLPLDVMALGRPRSSLLRCGAALHTAVWDAGYHGRSQSLLTVQLPEGFRLQRNARVVQLVFLRLAEPPEEGYEGQYLGEGL